MTLKTIIKICEVLGGILTILGGIMLPMNKAKIIAIWITFSGLVILLLGLALYLQNEVVTDKVLSNEKESQINAIELLDSLNKENSEKNNKPATKDKANNDSTHDEDTGGSHSDPYLDISSAVLSKTSDNEATVLITLTNFGTKSVSDVVVYSNAILNPHTNHTDFTIQYKNENPLGLIPSNAGKTMFIKALFNDIPLRNVINEKLMYLYVYGKIVYNAEHNNKTFIKKFSFYYDPNMHSFVDVNNGLFPLD